MDRGDDGDQDPQRPLLITLALLTTVTAIVSSLGAPLVPAIAQRYDVPIASAQWTLTATLLAGAVVTPILGRVAVGRRRRLAVLLTTGTVLVGTVLSALPLGDLGYPALLAGRALQGAGLGLVPLALAIARDHTRGVQMARWLGLLSVTTVAGAGLGYPVTAFVAQHAGLAGAYWFGAGLLAVTITMAALNLPPHADDVRPRIDLFGTVLLTVGMLGALLAVSQGEHWGWTSSPTLTLGLLGLAVLAVWVPWTLRHPAPLVDLRLATRPGLAATNVVTVLLGLGMYSILTLVVILIQADPATGFGLGRGIGATGLLLVPYAIFSISGNRAAQRVSQRFGPRALLPVGCAAFMFSLLMLAAWHTELWQVLAAMALGGLGSGFSFASLPALIVPHVPPAETSSALAFNQLLRYIGFTIGSATCVALLDLFGADDHAFVVSLLVLAALCLLAAVISVLDRRPPIATGTAASTGPTGPTA